MGAGRTRLSNVWGKSMELRPRSHEAIVELIRKGVQIPNPLTLDVGPEVDLDRISSTLSEPYVV